MDSQLKSTVYVERQLYHQEELNAASQYQKPYRNRWKKYWARIKRFHIGRFLLNRFPVSRWIMDYNFKTDLICDVVAGVTVAVMHIPQGMAYGLLGNVPPIIGIYMAFFPVLIYTLLGTSKHVSMGTFAVVCLMVGKVVTKFTTENVDVVSSNNGTNITHAQHTASGPHYTNIEVATAVSFTVALFQLAMYLLRLGILSTFLSSTLVNAFTTGSAFHVLISQLKDLFGLQVQSRRGVFKNGFAVYDAIVALPKANYAAVVVSLVACFVMGVNNECLKIWVSKRCKYPIPIELIVVAIGTFVSWFVDLNGLYNITLVGDVPTGLPMPVLPTFALMKDVAFDSFSISIVSYAVTMSMALIFAQKFTYELDANQELLALGASNLFGSCFSCMPIAASLSRSFIQQLVGGVTQIASLVSCAILLVVLLWVGPVFQFLPRCILASIIVVALKGLFVQASDLVKFWKLSKLDALVWIVTLGTVVLADIDIGLLAGFVTSILVICIQSFKPNTCLLGVVPNTEIYLDVTRYKGVEEVEGIKIFHYVGGLNFATRAMFKTQLVKRVRVDARKILQKLKKVSKAKQYEAAQSSGAILVQKIIIDLSAVNYIDPAGVEQLNLILTEYAKIEIDLYLANASGAVYETIRKCDSYTNRTSTFTIFPTIHDAVLYAKMSRFEKQQQEHVKL